MISDSHRSEHPFSRDADFEGESLPALGSGWVVEGYNEFFISLLRPPVTVL